MPKWTSLAAAALIAAAGGAQAQEGGGRIELGMLTCSLTERTNMVVVSKTRFACEFAPSDGRPTQTFDGVIGKLGVDLSLKTAEFLAWGVLAPSVDADAAAMQGVYVGAGADAALGAGVGANVLIGGLDNAIVLQPVSVSGSAGVGATVAVQRLRLTHTGSDG